MVNSHVSIVPTATDSSESGYWQELHMDDTSSPYSQAAAFGTGPTVEVSTGHVIDAPGARHDGLTRRGEPGHIRSFTLRCSSSRAN